MGCVFVSQKTGEIFYLRRKINNVISHLRHVTKLLYVYWFFQDRSASLLVSCLTGAHATFETGFFTSKCLFLIQTLQKRQTKKPLHFREDVL